MLCFFFYYVEVHCTYKISFSAWTIRIKMTNFMSKLIGIPQDMRYTQHSQRIFSFSDMWRWFDWWILWLLSFRRKFMLPASRPNQSGKGETDMRTKLYFRNFRCISCYRKKPPDTTDSSQKTTLLEATFFHSCCKTLLLNWFNKLGMTP
jgi:hypothetical protein